MIRPFRNSDMDEVIGIWIEASEEVHNFVKPGFWRSRAGDMQENYIPASETYVFEESGKIKGFFCLYGNTLAALFVDPRYQGRGIGGKLVEKAMELRGDLGLTVYRENRQAVRFYEKHGFKAVSCRVDENTGHREIIMKGSAGTVK